MSFVELGPLIGSGEERYKTPHAKRSIYFDLFELPIAVAFYVLSLIVKHILWISTSPAEYLWRNLFIVNMLEALAWSAWILCRHRKSMGPALLLIPFTCTVYTNVPIALLAAGLNIFPFQDQTVRQGMWMQSLFSTNLWMLIGILFSRSTTKQMQQRISLWFASLRATKWGIRIFVTLGIINACAILINFYVSGAASMAGVEDRATVGAAVETGKIWLLTSLFIVWMMACIIAWCSPRVRAAITKVQMFFVAVALFIFMSAYIRLGDRRNLLELLIFCFVILCIKGRVNVALIISSFMIPPLIYMSLSRSLGTQSITDLSPLSFYLNLLGEFIFPHFPLLNHIETGSTSWWGWSYLRLPGYLLPSFGLWHKSLSLSQQFAADYADNTMGYAFTPLGEGYLNFGFLAVFLVPLLLAGTLRLLAFWKRGFPILFLLFLAGALDINRGESVSVESGLLITFIMMLFFLRVLRFGYPRRRGSSKHTVDYRIIE